MDYVEARKLLKHAGTGRELERKKVGNNTYARLLEDGSVAIQLHATDVVTVHPDDTATLRAGGWLTTTTKDRMNTYAQPYRVSATRGVWNVWAILERGRWDTADGRWEAGADYIGAEVSSSVPFFEGMRVDLRDPRASMLELERAPAVVEALEANARDKDTKARISRFTRALTREGIAEALEHEAGDCFMCRGMFGANTGADHLWSHMDDVYFPARLLLAAVTECGYRDPMLILHMEARDTSSAPTMTRRALRRFLEARLLEGGSTGRRGSALVADHWA